MADGPDFEVCDRCEQRPSEAPLCASCMTNQTAIYRLRRENAALIEVYVLAARMRSFPVPFDQHFELVGAVDECRPVIEPSIDDYGAPAETAPCATREDFLLAFRVAHAVLHQLWSDAVGQPGYDKKRWIALDNTLSQFARDAGEMFGISRSEPLL